MLLCRSLLRCANSLFCLSLVIASCSNDFKQKYTPKPARQRRAELAWHQSSSQNDLAHAQRATAEYQARIHGLQNDLAHARSATAEYQARIHGLQDDLAHARSATAEYQARIHGLQDDLARARLIASEYQARIHDLQNDLTRERRIAARHQARIHGLQNDLVYTQSVLAELYSLQSDLELALGASARPTELNGIAIPETWQVSIESRDMLPLENDGGCPICVCYESFFQYGMCRCPCCSKFFCQQCYRECRRTSITPLPKCPCCRTALLNE
jgi:hypothetical protein